jgi:hypothetical protein
MESLEALGVGDLLNEIRFEERDKFHLRYAANKIWQIERAREAAADYSAAGVVIPPAANPESVLNSVEN